MTDIVAKKLKAPLVSLTPKHEQVLSLLVHGDDTGGGPLSVNETAERMNVRRAYVRDLMADPLFKTRYNAAVANARGAIQPALIANLSAIATYRIAEPKGSDVISAAKLLMGEDSKGFSVNVQVNNQTNIENQIRPGYVLDLSALKDKSPMTIEGKVE